MCLEKGRTCLKKGRMFFVVVIVVFKDLCVAI